MTTDKLLKQFADLQALVTQQAATSARLEVTIAQQAARIAELEPQLDDAQRRGKRQARLSSHGYRVACGRLLERHYCQPEMARFAKLLRKQRAYLFTFLHVAEVAPTNNAAERELRPAVIIRKTNGCNRSAAGATAHSVLSSVIRTCEKQGLDFIHQTRKVLQTAGPVLLDLCGSDPDPPVLPADQAMNPAWLPVLGGGTASASASP